MASLFYQNFSLLDIFNNKKLKNKLPLINYKEKEREDGKISRTTQVRSVKKIVFDTSVSAARPFYSPLKATRGEGNIILDGELTGDHDEATEAVFVALKGIRSLLVWTANNADMIRDALKETAKNKRKYGVDSKLFLRAKSMQEIEGMSKQQLQALLTDIMENIFYGDDFPETQKKYGVEQLEVGSALSYKQRRLKWKMKIGGI